MADQPIRADELSLSGYPEGIQAELFLEVDVRIRRFIGTFVVAVALLAFATPAAAQDPQPVTVSGGVSFFHFNDCCTEVGLRAEVAKIFSQMNNGGVAVAGELGWTTGDFGSTLTLGAGPRYVMGLANSSVRPYVHVLVGLARYNFEFEDSANNFFVGPGGGVVFPLNDRVSAFGQVDIMIIRGDFEDSGQRFTFGVALDVGQ